MPMRLVPFNALQTMSDKDRVCSLMFDETSTRKSVLFNQKFGCIEGFEDLGSHGRTAELQIMP